MRDLNKEKRINELWKLLKDSVMHRLNFTLQTTGVIAVILAILSFLGFLSNNQHTLIIVKVLLSVFLSMMLVSSFLCIYEINKGGVRARKALEEELNKKLSERDKNWIDSLCVFFPWIFLVALFLGVIIIITLLWV